MPTEFYNVYHKLHALQITTSKQLHSHPTAATLIKHTSLPSPKRQRARMIYGTTSAEKASESASR